MQYRYMHDNHYLNWPFTSDETLSEVYMFPDDTEMSQDLFQR